jgi:diguanylate cyclase (GGDEF)-like protein
MKVLLATGVKKLEEELMKYQGFHQSYNRFITMDIAATIKPDVVVVSPLLSGEEDLISSVIKPLRDENIRVIFCPGNPEYNDAREWMRQLIGWGIYDYVYDPVTADKILHRIENPGKLGDLPKDIVNEASKSEVASFIDLLPEEDDEEDLEKAFKNPFKKIKPKAKEKPKELPASGSNLPAIVEKPEKPEKPQRKKLKISFRGLFVKTGYIKDGKFYKHKATSVAELLEAETGIEAIVVPKSWDIGEIKKFQRDRRSKTILLIVLKGNKEHQAIGADYCVKKVTPQLAQEVSILSRKASALWRRVDTDPLTGAYTRAFLNEWLEGHESRKTPYSLVMLDLDHFKNVNDTYGHDAGDAVLAAFGDFLKSNIRTTGNDIVFRYGGEEFILVLPYTNLSQAYIVVDRLRKMWAERVITLPDGRIIKTTFSAGVAEWQEGLDTCKEADNMLYKAKNEGRNKVKAATRRPRVLVLGKIPLNEIKASIDVTYDPELATAVICDKNNLEYAPAGLPLYVLGTGQLSDWAIKKQREDAILCMSVSEIIEKIKPKTNLQVLPGVRTHDKSHTIPKNGTLYVVCPSRPAAAGEIAVKLVNSISNAALVCASPESTGAITIGIPEKQLITSDWRIINADAPVKWAGVYVWPIDPYKHISVPYDVHALVDQIKSKFSIVVVDCGASLDICTRISNDEGVLLLYKEGDASDVATKHWHKNHRGQNVLAMSPNEVPAIIEADNGYIISYQDINNQRQLIR